jgi:adenine deaminase
MKGHQMKHEYHEGQEALERFEKGMTTLFRAPKPRSKATAKKAVRKRSTKAQKGSTGRGGSQS